MTDEYAVVGRIRKPHGIRGELVVELFCDEPDAIFAPGRVVFMGDENARAKSGEAIEVTHGRPFKDTWLVRLKGVIDRNAAEPLRNVYLLSPLSALRPPRPDEVWLHELVGMRVSDVNGNEIGSVHQVTRLPHGHLLDVQTARGTQSIPFVDAIVVGVDREARTITVDPPEGLLDL